MIILYYLNFWRKSCIIVHENIKKMQKGRLSVANKLVSGTAEYIKHLKKEYGLNISIHFNDEFKGVFLAFAELFVFNNHFNPYCMCIKSDKELFGKCLECQAKTLGKCAYAESFIGVCHADVKELVYRVCCDGKAVGFLSVSGYKAEREFFKKSDFLKSIYDTHILRTEPPKDLCDIVIYPLCVMLEETCRLWVETGKLQENENTAVLAYISEHHTHLTLSELAEAFHRSRSSISHSFKKQNNMTLKSYCNRLKINDAKVMLQYSELPVTDIAYAVGFENLSYFINVFKRLEACTPLEYRKNKNV